MAKASPINAPHAKPARLSCWGAIIGLFAEFKTAGVKLAGLMRGILMGLFVGVDSIDQIYVLA